MPNPGPASTITEHPIGGGGGPAYVGVAGSAVGFYQDPFGGGAVVQRSGPVQAVYAISSAAGFLLNYTSLSQGAPALTAQNISSAQLTFSGGPMVSTADVLIVNKQIPTAQYGIAGVRVVSVSNNANFATIALNHANFNISGVSSTTPGGDTFIFTALRNALVNTVTLSPSVVAANSVAEQNFTVQGLQPGMMVALTKPTEQSGLGIGNVRVPTNNTLAVQFVNVANTAITPTASEVYQYSALAGVAAASPILVGGIYMGGATSGIAAVLTVSGGALTPAAITVTGINKDDLVLGQGQNIIAMTAANSVALVEARVSAAVVNTLNFTFLNPNTNSASITALSTDTWMVPILRPNCDAPMTLYPATVPTFNLGPNTCTEVGVTVTGLTVSCAVMAQKPSFTTGVTVVGYRVSSAAGSTVGITFGNPTNVTVTVPTETYTVAAFKPLFGTGHYVQQLVSPLAVAGIALTNELRNALAGTGFIAGS